MAKLQICSQLTETLNSPVIFNGTGLIPPATAINYVPWAAVGFVFQYVIRRRHFSWWTKYNYVLSAALDSGVAIGIVVIFFCLQFPKNGAIGADNLLKWWGNASGMRPGSDGGLVRLVRNWLLTKNWSALYKQLCPILWLAG